MRALIAFFIALLSVPALATEELISTAKYENGEAVPYILNSEGASPRYVVILFPARVPP